LNGGANLSAEIAIGFEKAFEAQVYTLMRMQRAYEMVHAQDIKAGQAVAFDTCAC